jgi:hypothetical protein
MEAHFKDSETKCQEKNKAARDAMHAFNRLCKANPPIAQDEARKSERQTDSVSVSIFLDSSHGYAHPHAFLGFDSLGSPASEVSSDSIGQLTRAAAD